LRIDRQQVDVLLRLIGEGATRHETTHFRIDHRRQSDLTAACTTTVVARPPRPGLVFVEGRWVARPRTGAVWIAPHWERRTFRRVWVAGYWR
jgi:hypothetical protein